MLQPYSEDIRKRAVELVLKEGKSYKVAAESVAEEFNIPPISKSTVYNWVKLEKKKLNRQEKEEPSPIEENQEKSIPEFNEDNSPKNILEEVKEVKEDVDTVSQKIKVPSKKEIIKDVEDVKKELGTNLPVITPQEVATQLQQNISQVPPGPLVVDQEKPTNTESDKPKKKSLLDKIRELSLTTNHFWIYIAILSGITFAALAGYKLATRKNKKEPEPVEPETVEEKEDKPIEQEYRPPYYRKATGVLITDLE